MFPYCTCRKEIFITIHNDTDAPRTVMGYSATTVKNRFGYTEKEIHSSFGNASLPSRNKETYTVLPGEEVTISATNGSGALKGCTAENRDGIYKISDIIKGKCINHILSE